MNSKLAVRRAFRGAFWERLHGQQVPHVRSQVCASQPPMQSSTMDGLSRSDTQLLDDHARAFARLRHFVLGRFESGREDILRTEARLKSHGSIWRHLDRGDLLSELVDLSGFRVITVYADSVDAVVAELSDLFPQALVKHQEKANGYRTCKLVVRLSSAKLLELGVPIEFDVLTFEVQVRSAMQHLWAALDRLYVYDQRADNDVLVGLFKHLAIQANAFDDALMNVRTVAEQQARAGRDSEADPALQVPISPETIHGAIDADRVATQYDQKMIEERGDLRGPHEPTSDALSKTAAMLRILGYDTVGAVLTDLRADRDYVEWLTHYNKRAIAQEGKRPVRRGDTLALFVEYRAAQGGLDNLRRAFRSAGIQSEAMVNRLYSEVQEPFARARGST